MLLEDLATQRRHGRERRLEQRNTPAAVNQTIGQRRIARMPVVQFVGRAALLSLHVDQAGCSDTKCEGVQAGRTLLLAISEQLDASILRHIFRHMRRLAAAKDIMDDRRPQRRPFRLTRVDNRSHAQIAADLGISVASVEKHVSRGLQDMRKALSRADLD